MKTPDMCHCDYEECETCYFSDMCNEKAQGLSYIRLLEQANDHKDKRIRQLAREKEQLMREKEKLIDGIRGLCGHCKHWGESSQTETCFSCIMLAAHNWEWIGVEEEK